MKRLLLACALLALPALAHAQGSSLGTASVWRTTSPASNIVVAGAHQLLGLHVGVTSPVVVMIFDAASVPADGPVTGANAPLGCFAVPPVASPQSVANVGMSNVPNGVPTSTGIVIVMSTGADCFTKTTTTTGFISALYQ